MVSSSFRKAHILLIAGCVLIACGRKAFGNRTRVAPGKAALVGTSMLDEKTLKDKNQKHAGTATKLVLHEDSRVEMFQVPNSSKELHTDVGTWNIVPDEEFWNIRILGQRYFASGQLVGQKSPYRINIVYVDFDVSSNTVDVSFVKKE